MRTFAKELVGLQPDVILANSTPVTAALKRETLTIPIVFAAVADPVGSKFVASLPRPGGNITGFGSLETSMASKWLELLTQIAPGIKKAAMMYNPDTAPYVKSSLCVDFRMPVVDDVPLHQSGVRKSPMNEIAVRGTRRVRHAL